MTLDEWVESLPGPHRAKKELANLKQQVVGGVVRYDGLNTDRESELMAENAQLRQQVAELANDNVQHRIMRDRECQERQREAETYLAEKEKLAKQVAELTQEKVAAQFYADNRNQRVVELVAERDELRTELESSDKEATAAVQECERLRAAVEHLRLTIAPLNQENARLRQENANFLLRWRESKSETELRAEVERLKDALSEANKIRAETLSPDAELARLRQDNERLQKLNEECAEQLLNNIKTIREQGARIARMDVALEPFAKAAEQVRDDWDNNDFKIFGPITIGNLKIAREARNLEQLVGKKKKILLRGLDV